MDLFLLTLRQSHPCMSAVKRFMGLLFGCTVLCKYRELVFRSIEFPTEIVRLEWDTEDTLSLRN